MRRVILALAILVAGCGSPDYSTSSDGGASEPIQTPQAATVRMESGGGGGYGGGVYYFFSPASVRLAKGGSVTWENTTGTGHNVTFDQADGAPARVETFGSGKQSRTFNTAGTFSYHCTLHTGMAGKIVVE